MVASATKRKSVNANSMTDAYVAVDLATSAVARYVSDWTTREIKKMMTQKTDVPLVEYDVDNYIVGKYRVYHNHNHWTSADAFSESETHFYLKISAMFYSLCRSAGYYDLSQTIYRADAEAGKHREDVMLYRQRLAKYKNSDDFKRNLWNSRLSDSEIKLKHAMKQLQKSLSRAKYLKVWSD